VTIALISHDKTPHEHRCENLHSTRTEQGDEKTFGQKRDEMVGDWRKLHNE
jgi:hypothetical protein